jgi:hypothetical protein
VPFVGGVEVKGRPTSSGLILNVGRACASTWNHQLTPELAAPCLSYIVLAANQAIQKMDADACVDLAYPCGRGQLQTDDVSQLFCESAPPVAVLLANQHRAVSIPLSWTDVSLTFCAAEIHSDEVVVALRARAAREHLNDYFVDICTTFFASPQNMTPAEMNAAFRELRNG